MTTAKHNIFTKLFWNRGRIMWGLIVAFCTSVPLVGGSLVMVSRWADANVLTPYLESKVCVVVEVKQAPIRQDIKTMISDVKFMRGCVEKTTSKEIQEVVISEMKYDSIANVKYNTR